MVGGLLAPRGGTAQPADAPCPLRVAEDERHLVCEDGTPYIWLGDTAWELFHRLDREQATTYLRDRAEKGFTIIQAVVLAEQDGLNTPNAYGHTPLANNDPTQPNEAYFEHVDTIVDTAEQLGLHIGMLPTWGDKFNTKWGVGPEIFTPENARTFGRFLGERYRNAPVVWILGGDRNPEDAEDRAIIRAMAEGLHAGDGGRHLMTYHPQGGSQSWQWFHTDDWLDFNMFQSGHGRSDQPNYRTTRAGYLLDPVKPVLDGEPRYEDIPVGFDRNMGWFDAFDVRQAAYWSMLAGAFGHTYGNNNIWQMWAPERNPILSARTPWYEALDHAGATHMGYMRRLFASRPFLDLVPDQAVLAGPAQTGGARPRRAHPDRVHALRPRRAALAGHDAGRGGDGALVQPTHGGGRIHRHIRCDGGADIRSARCAEPRQRLGARRRCSRGGLQRAGGRRVAPVTPAWTPRAPGPGQCAAGGSGARQPGLASWLR